MRGSFKLFTNGMMDIDQKGRIAAFNWLDEKAGMYDDVLPRMDKINILPRI